MNKTEAYEIVLKDLSHSVKAFRGKYDARHGNKQFMYGIYTVMEYIAEQAGDIDFADGFIKNMIESETNYNATLEALKSHVYKEIWEKIKAGDKNDV